jgi:hypothetical protein
MICSGLWRLRFMGLLLANSGRYGSSHKNWFSFWGPRQNEHRSWVDTYQQAALERWALVESNIKAGHIEVLKDGEANDSSPLPGARQINLLLIQPPGKKVATKQIAASLLEKIKILQFTHLTFESAL